ncbi:MAG: hypothetical protein Q8K99_10530 [Actinomycetota bacterium]|nr:hypothetical protein [Actinomycetota bacterium]
MRFSSRFVLVATAVLLLAMVAAPAFAAPAAWQMVDVMLFPQQTGGVVVVSGELPTTASLPAEGELAVPAGSQIQWVGEILGGPTAEDPNMAYTKTTVNGMDVYSFTLTKSRVAQVEIVAADGPAFDGTAYTSTLNWVSAQDVPEVRLAIQLPKGSQVVATAEGATLAPGDETYNYYTKTVRGVKAGDALGLTVGYTVPAAPAGSAAPATTGTNPALPIILVLGGIAVAVLLLVMTRRKTPASSPDAEAPAVALGEYAEVVERAGLPPELPADEEAPTPEHSRTGATARTKATAAIIGVIVILAVVIATQTTKPQQVGDTISQTFTPGEPCTVATIPLVVADGADPQATADALFAALKPMVGLNTATYNIKTSSIEVGFCDSETSEAVVRQALAATGLVAEGGAPAPTP